MDILKFTEKGFVLTKEYIFYCYNELKKSPNLRNDYKIENFFYIASKNYIVIDNLLAFLDYFNNELTDYIHEDLNDIVDAFNNERGEAELEDINYEYNEDDLEYLKSFIKEKFPQYDPYIYIEHIQSVIAENYKLLNGVKHKKLIENQYYKGLLIANLQVKLVGVQEPAPCAKKFVKDRYYSLYANLTKRY